MDANEFPMPSPKRRRSNSPSDPAASKEEAVPVLLSQPNLQNQDSPAAKENNDILDALMQHVESESTPHQPNAVAVHHEEPKSIESTSLQTSTIVEPNGTLMVSVSKPQDIIMAETEAETETTVTLEADTGNQDVAVNAHPDTKVLENQEPEPSAELPISIISTTPHPDPSTTNATQILTSVDAIPADNDMEQPTAAEGAEWEIDSSPYESSSDSDSSDETSDDDSDDEDAEGDYAMLDPEEQARILMHGDVGSDDEGGASKTKAEGSGYKTANEQSEDVPVIPDVTITEDMKIEELGLVEAVVENNVLIRAKVSGEYQVLESASLLCLADRKIAGVVAETLGRVEQPLYTMRFKNQQDIQERGLNKGTMVFYVHSHSSFVFTQPLKAVKGSDASNIHDEEVGADEMEFSDDEAEAEHKRLMKLKRQGRLGEAGRGRGSGKGRGGRGGNNKSASVPTTNTNGAAYGNGSLEMNYDDVEGGEEGYTPLRRPSNLHAPGTSPDNTAGGSVSYMPPPPSRDRERGRGRGGHERGRGGRNNFRGRGAFQHQQHGQRNTPPQQNQYHPGFLNPALSSQFPPPPPLLTPQQPGYLGGMATSPMSPLPQQQFNFASAFQAPQFGGYQQQQQHQHQQYQQHQQQQQYPQQNPLFNPAAMQQFMQQQQMHHQQQQQQQQAPQWHTNQAAVVEVQKQLEEMRKAASQNQQYQQ